MQFDFDVEIKQVLRDLESYSDDVQHATNREMAKTASLIEGEAIRRIQRAPAGGKTYKRGNVTHKASAAGEYPKTDTDNLVASIRSIREQTIKGLDSWLVGSSLDYAEYLEFGTLDMSPRPWLEPTARALSKNHVERIETAIRRALNAT